MVRGWFVNGFWVIWSGSRGVVRGRGVSWGGVVRGMVGNSHSHSASQQHFAQHDVHSREDKSNVNENYRDPEILYKQSTCELVIFCRYRAELLQQTTDSSRSSAV